MTTYRLPLLVGLAALHFVPAASRAQQAYPPGLSQNFPIDNQDPEGHLPSPEQLKGRPLDYGYLLMDLDERGEVARQRGDWNAALKFHRAAAKLEPDRAVSFTLLCRDYEMLGKRKESLTACAQALTLPGAKTEHFAQFVRLVATRSDGPDPLEVEDAEAAIEHVKAQPEAGLAAHEMECELSVSTKNASRLESCLKELEKHAPDAPRVIAFAWALALQKRDFKRAAELIEKAKREGAEPKLLAKMERTTSAAKRGEEVVRNEDESDGAKSASSASAQTVVSGGMHPMLKWSLGLAIALLIGTAVARRLMRGSVSSS